MTEEIIKVICGVPFEKWRYTDTGFKTELSGIEINLVKNPGPQDPYLRINDWMVSDDLITDVYLTLEKAETQKKILEQQKKVEEIFNKIVV